MNPFLLGIRFGDGYIMIGFSAGYLIVISTYHKEIGEVNKNQNFRKIKTKKPISLGIT